MKKALMVYEKNGVLNEVHQNVRERSYFVDTAASHSEVTRKMSSKKYDYIFIHDEVTCKIDIIKELQKDSKRFFNPQNQKPIRYFSAKDNDRTIKSLLDETDLGLFVITN